MLIAIEAHCRKITCMVVPEAYARKPRMVSGVEVYPVRSLLDVIHFINSGNGIQPIYAHGDSFLRGSRSSSSSTSKTCEASKPSSASSKSRAPELTTSR